MVRYSEGIDSAYMSYYIRLNPAIYCWNCTIDAYRVCLVWYLNEVLTRLFIGERKYGASMHRY